MTSSSMLLKLLLVLSIFSVVFSVDDKCSACNAVAVKFDSSLSFLFQFSIFSIPEIWIRTENDDYLEEIQFDSYVSREFDPCRRS